jgi:hypothetical protein
MERLRKSGEKGLSENLDSFVTAWGHPRFEGRAKARPSASCGGSFFWWGHCRSRDRIFCPAQRPLRPRLRCGESPGKKFEPAGRTIEKSAPMMSMALLLLGAGGRGFSKIPNPLNRVSPRLPSESFEKTGHIQAHSIDTTPREDETPAESRRSRLSGGMTPRRVSRPPGGYETALNGGFGEWFSPPMEIIEARPSAVLLAVAESEASPSLQVRRIRTRVRRSALIV